MRILFIILIFLSCCSLRKEDSTDKKKIFPNMTQDHYNHFIYKNGRLYLDAKVSLALFFDKQNKIEVEGILAKIYNSSGEITTLIEANRGIVDRGQKSITFSEKVRMESFEQKIKMFSEEIILDYLNDKLIANSDTLVQKDDGSYLKSKYFESLINESETKFKDLELQYFYNDEKEKKDDEEKK